MSQKPEFTIHHLTSEDMSDFADAAKLLDAMSHLHTEKVVEVFDGKQPTKDADYVAETIAEPRSQIYVAKNGQHIIGVLRASIIKSEDVPGWRLRRYGSIEAMFVEPQCRRKGVGAALMQSACDYFKQSGLQTVELNVWDFNQEAQGLYRKLGFSTKNTNLWRKL